MPNAKRGTLQAANLAHVAKGSRQAFRYNHRKVGGRKLTEAERFNAVVGTVAGSRLTYEAMTGKESETAAL